jgi:hypothetical protein
MVKLAGPEDEARAWRPSVKVLEYAPGQADQPSHTRMELVAVHAQSGERIQLTCGHPLPSNDFSQERY